MLSLAFTAITTINFMIVDYKHVVSLATAEIEMEPEPVYETFEVTAYTAGPESTGKAPGHPLYGVTASGEYVQEGRTIACPKSMPFGTKVYIPYFDNTFVCEDRGSAITEGKLDVYMQDVSDALKFGRRQLEVVVY